MSTEIPNNHKHELYNVILDREGLNEFLKFMSDKNSSDVDYGVNKYGEVFINLKNTKKINITPINFYDIITNKIKLLEKQRTKIKQEQNKEKEKFFINVIDFIYDMINENKK